MSDEMEKFREQLKTATGVLGMMMRFLFDLHEREGRLPKVMHMPAVTLRQMDVDIALLEEQTGLKWPRDPDGSPMIGGVKVSGMSDHEFEKSIAAAQSGGLPLRTAEIAFSLGEIPPRKQPDPSVN